MSLRKKKKKKSFLSETLKIQALEEDFLVFNLKSSQNFVIHENVQNTPTLLSLPNLSIVIFTMAASPTSIA